jgi:hypothetical protein
MWMADPAFLGTNILEEEGVRIFGVANMQALKLNETETSEWRRACYARLGVEDPEEYELSRIRAGRFYREWKADLEALMRNPPPARGKWTQDGGRSTGADAGKAKTPLKKKASK